MALDAPTISLADLMGTLPPGLATYLARLEARVAELEGRPDPEAHLPEACRKHECTYFKHYLVYGGPELQHDAYHEAERQCDHWQRRCLEWCEQHEWRGHCPWEPTARRWEAKVRA